MTHRQEVQELTASIAHRLIKKHDQGNSRAGRLQLSCRLSFTDDRAFEWQGMLLDISLCGCRMFSAEHLQEGQHVKVSICLSDQTDPLRIEKAIVRWVQKGQVGLEFISLQSEELDRLCALSIAAERGRT
jgi:hypothetical protein